MISQNGLDNGDKMLLYFETNKIISAWITGKRLKIAEAFMLLK